MKVNLYISLLLLSVLSINILTSQDEVRMIEDRISKEKVLELGEKVDFVKTRKIWQPRQGFGGDTKRVNRRDEAMATDYREPQEEVENYNLRFLEPLFFLIKYAMIILLIAVVLYMIVMALQQIKDDGDSMVDVEDSLESLEEDIREMDLEGMLSEALETANYKLAIRAQFLILLKKLTDKELIDWSIEKTNRDYIRELSKHPSIETFKQVTLGFELAWYGDQESDRGDYASFEVLTQRFQNSISSYSTTAV